MLKKKKTNLKFIIIHGSFGTPDENWFPWLASELRKNGFQVFVPAFPTPNEQSLEKWLHLFKIQIGELDSNTILIGHSLAPAFILTLLEKSKYQIAGAVLVSGFVANLGIQEFDEVNKTFVNRNFNWKKIKNNARNFIVINSDNDPYVPLEKGAELSNKLETNFSVVKKGGHLNSSAGYSKFPFLLKKINEMFVK